MIARTYRSRRNLALMLLAVSPLLTTCGDGKKKGGGGGAPVGQVEATFQRHAQTNRIPVRMLMAVAFTESKMNPDAESAVYTNAEAGTEKRSLGFTLTENAFGIPRKTLSLEGNEKAQDLETQIEHYAKWVRAELDKEKIELNPSPTTANDKFQWIWRLAQLHRNGEQQRRNVRVVFARNLINTLNKGDMWQDPKNGQILELKKETPEIKVTDFNEPDQRLFRLRDDSSQIGNNARQFELTSPPASEIKNNPTHIQVIHCPLNLSACLELQNPTRAGDQVRLQAHYVIPPDQSVVEKPLQVAAHEDIVQLTNNRGDTTIIDNAIVIMLVGQSGRYVGGVRNFADPTWFTNWQLSHLGAIASAVCSKMKEKNDAIDHNKCMAPGQENGVMFQHQGSSDFYQWGDIPDYDETIFWAYLKSADNMIDGEASLTLSQNRKAFQAGENIGLRATFQIGAKQLHLERAIRCDGDNQKLVWATARTEPVRSKTTFDFTQNVLDGGPNGNGRQFYRILVYDGQNQLIGWSVVDFYVTKFDEDSAPAVPKTCIRSGT